MYMCVSMCVCVCGVYVKKEERKKKDMKWNIGLVPSRWSKILIDV